VCTPAVTLGANFGHRTGGGPSLGYQARDRKLVIADGEAEIVRSIFRRYAELGSVRLLKDELVEGRARSPQCHEQVLDERAGGCVVASHSRAVRFIRCCSSAYH
jgi:hypothetical protein